MNFENAKEKKPVDVEFSIEGKNIYWRHVYDDNSESKLQPVSFSISADPDVNAYNMLKFKEAKLAELGLEQSV